MPLADVQFLSAIQNTEVSFTSLGASEFSADEQMFSHFLRLHV
jgi:hypothetical protein